MQVGGGVVHERSNCVYFSDEANVNVYFSKGAQALHSPSQSSRRLWRRG